MRIITMFPPRFFADDGELITVTVTAQNPNMVHLVSFQIGQQQGSIPAGSAAQFQMSQAAPDVIFVLQLGFQPDDGTGAYEVQIVGNPAEATYRDVFDSKFGINPLALPFEFLISNS